jgi:hypothetical protein
MHGKILHFFYFVKHMQDLEIYSRTIGTTCDDVKMKIKSQIALWTTAGKNKASSKRTSLSSHSLTQSRFVHTCLRKTNTFTYMCMFNSINKILTVYRHFSPPFLQLSAVVQSAIWFLIFILTSSHVVPNVLEYISKSCMCLTK